MYFITVYSSVICRCCFKIHFVIFQKVYFRCKTKDAKNQIINLYWLIYYILGKEIFNFTLDNFNPFKETKCKHQQKKKKKESTLPNTPTTGHTIGLSTDLSE